jgi:hypothetical protein
VGVVPSDERGEDGGVEGMFSRPSKPPLASTVLIPSISFENWKPSEVMMAVGSAPRRVGFCMINGLVVRCCEELREEYSCTSNDEIFCFVCESLSTRL